MDKILAIILIFVAMMIIMAAVLAMGAVPKIYQGVEISNQTLIQQHEDDARNNQSQLILNNTSRVIYNHQKDLEEYMTILFNDNHQLLQNQETMLKGIQKILDDAVAKMTEHQLTIKKYGTENNALGRAIAKELGLNVTTILNDYYTEHNMTPIYPPPPKPAGTN
jgi:predicted P-loop ATPase/GTPase